MSGERFPVAVFRPADERLEAAVALVESLGGDPVADPMLAVDPTGAAPRTDADVAVFTAKTGAELAAGVDLGAATVAAVGPATADALRDAGVTVDVVPEEFSSSGLVAALRDRVAGSRVEVARSDHGSDVLLDGLRDAGAYVHETVLYRLVRPAESGESAERAARGELAAALFTSSLTVEHFLEAAAERGVRDDAIAGLNDPDTTVGAIGEPTRRTAADHGVAVDVVPSAATFEALATETIEAAAPTHRD